ncbi:MAG: DUF4190 domain-containing protein [Clostridia bacterium]|nr:DUF4190 domain-containing protein [Clostridia bacterium]
MSEKNEFENNNFSGGQNEFAYQNVNNFGKPKTIGWSVVSLVTGIISVICCCLGVTGIVFGAAAIVTAILSRKVLGYFDGLSIAGLVLGIFGIVFGASILIAISALGEEFWEEYMEEFKKAYGEMYPEI